MLSVLVNLVNPTNDFRRYQKGSDRFNGKNSKNEVDRDGSDSDVYAAKMFLSKVKRALHPQDYGNFFENLLEIRSLHKLGLFISQDKILSSKSLLPIQRIDLHQEFEIFFPLRPSSASNNRVTSSCEDFHNMTELSKSSAQDYKFQSASRESNFESASEDYSRSTDLPRHTSALASTGRGKGKSSSSATSLLAAQTGGRGFMPSASTTPLPIPLPIPMSMPFSIPVQMALPSTSASTTATFLQPTLDDISCTVADNQSNDVNANPQYSSRDIYNAAKLSLPSHIENSLHLQQGQQLLNPSYQSFSKSALDMQIPLSSPFLQYPYSTIQPSLLQNSQSSIPFLPFSSSSKDNASDPSYMFHPQQSLHQHPGMYTTPTSYGPGGPFMMNVGGTWIAMSSQVPGMSSLMPMNSSAPEFKPDSYMAVMSGMGGNQSAISVSNPNTTFLPPLAKLQPSISGAAGSTIAAPTTAAAATVAAAGTGYVGTGFGGEEVCESSLNGSSFFNGSSSSLSTASHSTTQS